MNKIGWIIAIIFFLSFLYTKNLPSPQGEDAERRIGVASDNGQGDLLDTDRIKIITASESAEGVIQANLDMNFLANFEAHTVERTIVKAREYLKANGFPDRDPDLSSESVYMEVGPMKLAVVRLSDTETSSVIIGGIVGSEFKRVLCVRNTREKIPVSYGVCADEIQRTFGISMSP